MSDNTEKTFEFDKFMKDFEKKDTEKRERAEDYAEGIEESFNRDYYKRYQEDWRNSTRWRR
jgi:acyl-ACP thioesterase